MSRYKWHTALVLLFAACSLPLFFKVFATTRLVVDELFHLTQGLHFCNKQFHKWDPKITTFPGLYLAALLLIPLNFCNILGLRAISMVAACANVVLIFVIRRTIFGNIKSPVAALDAFTIAFLPPLYFFSHLYYTDTLSLTSVLLFYYFWQRGGNLPASVYGTGSVLIRQTNVIYVGMAFGINALDIFTTKYARLKGVKPRAVKIYKPTVILDILTRYNFFRRCMWDVLKDGVFYLAVLLPFVEFLRVNGAIVVGDRLSHQATLHIPQLFYFSIFCLIFAVSNTINKFRSTMIFIFRHKYKMIILTLVAVVIVHFNTLVHPFILADNRHYVFYIWHRFFRRYWWFKYCMCPLYIVALTFMYQGLRHLRFSLKFMYIVSVILVLCFQTLLELRYFITPFVIFRLNLKPNLHSKLLVWIELGFYIAVNALTFYIFFTKEIAWVDCFEPQRLVW